MLTFRNSLFKKQKSYLPHSGVCIGLWSLFWFMEGIPDAELMDRNEIFTNDLVCFHYHLCEILTQKFLSAEFFALSFLPMHSTLYPHLYPHCTLPSTLTCTPNALYPLPSPVAPMHSTLYPHLYPQCTLPSTLTCSPNALYPLPSPVAPMHSTLYPHL